MKQLSVIILTYNSEKDIYDCLGSVYQYNDIGDDLEVIVVDNQSQGYKVMYERLEKEYPQVHTMQNTHNGGYGQGNNVGIRVAQAPIVAIMNPDVRLVMPCFKTMLQQFNNPQVVMCGGKQMYPNGKPGWSFACDYNIWGPIRIIARNIFKRFDHYNYTYMHLSGAFFLIRKDKFTQIGLFDEGLFMYGEEADIHMRLRKTFPTNYMLFLPTITYLHLSSERNFSEKQIKNTIHGDTYVFHKHHLPINSYFRTMLWTTSMLQIRALLQGQLKTFNDIAEQKKILRHEWKIYNQDS